MCHMFFSECAMKTIGVYLLDIFESENFRRKTSVDA